MRERMDLTDYVTELTQPHTATEHYTIRSRGHWVGLDHRVQAPSLLDQLWNADTPNTNTDEGPRSGYATSQPGTRLDALDVAVRIDVDASRWVRNLGEDDPGDTAACIRRLHGLHPSADPVTRRAIERDVRRWWIRARVATGWDSPAWAPDNTCPLCGERGTLRIRLAERVATCVADSCRETWDEQTIGLLADHIRAESEAGRRPKPRPGPCWCPWPRPIVPDLSRTCLRCGSARCRHAVDARRLEQLRRELLAAADA